MSVRGLLETEAKSKPVTEPESESESESDHEQQAPGYDKEIEVTANLLAEMQTDPVMSEPTPSETVSETVSESVSESVSGKIVKPKRAKKVKA